MVSLNQKSHGLVLVLLRLVSVKITEEIIPCAAYLYGENPGHRTALANAEVDKRKLMLKLRSLYSYHQNLLPSLYNTNPELQSTSPVTSRAAAHRYSRMLNNCSPPPLTFHDQKQVLADSVWVSPRPSSMVCKVWERRAVQRLYC
ncbi:hypothetical protein RRG08_010543 [Elysia crispata]|uniref:Uncharacterized protein n=1 Tax=Elysia crispata TaxID=231223 RepID=A0AAE1DWV2_9GAST|nr:hypothetical protein RRG08_010543 [Elysia crispata]